MLLNTFIHIPGIGEKTEKQIWESGILAWDQWQPPYPAQLSRKKINLITYHLQHYLEEQDGSAAFYAKLLQPIHHWRLFPHFRDHTAYLDIETTGMGWDQCEITSIALYDGRQIRTYVQGHNLEQFIYDIDEYEVIVTYNGKNFDVPVIESYLRTKLPHVHIDLRHILARLGYKGGLKGCERQLGINRMELAGVDGYWAVLLWQKYMRSGDNRALQTLLAYNIADAVNLEPLLVHAYNLNIAGTPFALSHYIPLPESPASPFSPDQEIIRQIREMLHAL